MHSLVLEFRGPAPRRNIMINDQVLRNYIMLVDRVLQQHMGQYLKEFKIVWHLDRFSQKDIDKWLVFALGKKVECLEFNLDYDCDPEDLAYACYPADLTYNNVFPGPFLKFGSEKPNSNGGKNRFLLSGLKCLKSLSLRRVDISGEAINFVLLNCPLLERLEVVGSSTLVNLVISEPTFGLKYLRIWYCFALKVLSISNFNGDTRVLRHSISQASSGFAHLEAFTLKGIDLKGAVQLFSYDQLTKLKQLVLAVEASRDNAPNAISIINACPCLEEFVFKLVRPKPWGRRFFASLKVFEFVG